MKYKLTIIFVLLFFALILAFTVTKYSDTMTTQSTKSGTPTTVIIDAGHGGEDGGAVGVDGVVEKNLNLPIALKVAELLEKDGVKVVLTRDDDYAIYSDEATSIREKKVSDIHNRFAMIEETENCIFVSIHMNHYDSPSCSGAQTFYSDNNEESKVLAQTIQSSIKEDIQPSNERQIKPATSSIYLLYYAQVPAVLVECGFISNPEESRKLQDAAYQEQMAISISKGILDYLGKQEQNISDKKSEKTTKKSTKSSNKETTDKKSTTKASTTKSTTIKSE